MTNKLSSDEKNYLGKITLAKLDQKTKDDFKGNEFITKFSNFLKNYDFSIDQNKKMIISQQKFIMTHRRINDLISDKNKALLPIINKAIAHVSDEQKTALAHKWFLSKQQGLLSVPYSPLLDYAREENNQRQLKEVNLNGEANYVYVSPFGSYGGRNDYLGIAIPVQEVLSGAQEKVTFSLLMSIGFLLLLLPAPWLFASPIVTPIKKLAEENQKIRERQFEDLSIPDSFIREIDELGHSMEDMVTAIRQHETNQDKLMDSFIQLIAQAIDDKSHYTASHCERVPELAFMLAEQAEGSLAPAFRLLIRDICCWILLDNLCFFENKRPFRKLSNLFSPLDVLTRE